MFIATSTLAQSPQRQPGNAELNTRISRPTAIKQLGLADQRLGLTLEQRTAIDKIVDAYLAEQDELSIKYPARPGTPPDPEGVMARAEARARMSARIVEILSAEQRKTWAVTRQPDSTRLELQRSREASR